MNLHEKFAPTIYHGGQSGGGDYSAAGPVPLEEFTKSAEKRKRKSIIPVGGLQDLHDAIDSYRSFVKSEPEANEHNYQRQEELRKNVRGTSIDRIIAQETVEPESHAAWLQDYVQENVLETSKVHGRSLAFITDWGEKVLAASRTGQVADLVQGERLPYIENALDEETIRARRQVHVLDGKQHDGQMYILTEAGIYIPDAIDTGHELTAQLQKRMSDYTELIAYQDDLLVRSKATTHNHYSIKERNLKNTPEISAQERTREFTYREEKYTYDAKGEIALADKNEEQRYTHTQNYAHYLETGSLDVA